MPEKKQPQPRRTYVQFVLVVDGDLSGDSANAIAKVIESQARTKTPAAVYVSTSIENEGAPGIGRLSPRPGMKNAASRT